MPTLRRLVQLSFMSFFGLASLLILVLISSSPVQEHLVVHSQIHTIPHEFLVNGAADSDQLLNFTIELVSKNMSGLEQELYAVSDPRSPKYGQHLSRTQVDSFVRPSEEASSMLDQWLANQGITSSSKSSAGNFVKIQVTVNQANAMFNTTFQSITHVPSNRSMIRALAYSLPERLANHTQGVYPITNLPQLPSVSSVKKQIASSNATFSRGIDPGCEEALTLVCVRDLYNIPDDATTQGATGGVGIPTFTNENNVVKGADIAKYLQKYRPEVSLSGVRVDIMSVSGGDDLQAGFSEDQGSSDTQLVLGISPHSPITIYPNPGENGLPDLLDTFNTLLDQKNVPSVISLNYALQESIEDSDVKIEKALFNCMMQLGTLGVSILVTSGDAGVLGTVTSIVPCIEGPTVINNLSPAFPASCPFVTSVGATVLSSDVEMAWSASGSGFSNIFSRKTYQSEAVANYLEQIGPLNNGMFNINKSSGRGYPDIAAIKTSLQFMLNGLEIDPNTSINVPIVAAIIADLNAKRQNQGKPSLGFLNPLLYSNPKAFIDITQGNNSVAICNVTGFPAVQGWDAVTGLGSPNYTALLEII